MTNNKQQTAVEWFNDKILIHLNFDQRLYLKDIFKQAKEMEKQQMWEYIKKNYCIGHRSLEFHRLEFEQYYEETYGGGDK